MKKAGVINAAGLTGLLVFSNALYGFETTKVPPKGVRTIMFRNVTTSVDQKTDSGGKHLPLAEPLTKALTFRRILNGEKNPFKRNSMAAFLTREAEAGNINIDDNVGTFTGEVKANIDVFAPVMAWGLTDTLALAVGAPVYHITTNVTMGFQPNNATAEQFLGTLAYDMRQAGSTRDTILKLNDARGEADRTLEEYGYRPLGPWEETGIGDTIIALKQLIYSEDNLAIAWQGGLVAPTGAIDDPDIQGDLAMGDGQWDAFLQFAFDEPLGGGLVLNQYAKYTYQAPGKKPIRLATELESVRVAKEDVAFKLGDKMDAGLSVMYEPPSGLQLGLGGTWFKKYGDTYFDVPTDVNMWLTRESEQEATYGEARIGYSTLPAYLRGEVMAPFGINLDYRKQLASRNQPITDFFELDFNIFF